MEKMHKITRACNTDKQWLELEMRVDHGSRNKVNIAQDEQIKAQSDQSKNSKALRILSQDDHSIILSGDLTR